MIRIQKTDPVIYLHFFRGRRVPIHISLMELLDIVRV